MAKKLPRRIAERTAIPVENDDPTLREARQRLGSPVSEQGGGAWAAASTAVISGELEKLQSERIEKLLSGNLVIELQPGQIEDEVGSDRSDDWKADEAFASLKSSLETNGQDVPIQVVPAEPDWQPVFNETDGLFLENVKFKVISGRRRLEALRQLGRAVRAVCIQIERRRETFDQLHRRFRENAERENLSLFDELLALGEMFSHAKSENESATGRAVAQTLGVGEAKLSRGRALYDNRERIFAEIDKPQSLTLHELDRVIPALRAGDPIPELAKDETSGNAVSKPQGDQTSRPLAIKRTQIIKGKKIVARAKSGKITLDLGDEARIDETFLDKLLLFIQTERGR